jgi:transposase
MKGASVVDFLKMLSDSTDVNKIHLILDKGRSNKNKEVQKYLDGQSKIQIHYLPPYFHNLSAIENLRKMMRECITYNKIYPIFAYFTEKIREFFKNGVVNLKDMLKNRINDNFQIIELNRVQISSC